jgi:hypothetical protein
VVVSDALIGHRFQDVLQRVVRTDGDRLTIAVFTCPGLRRVLAECKYPRLYSPEWVEGGFCEVGLPFYGVLGSSSKSFKHHSFE